jgi:GNAT superfamily N-acetyltransferase
MNPSSNDECGLLVSGFDTPPVFMMPHNPPYYSEFVAAEGFQKAKDLLAYYLDLANTPMERFERIAHKIRQRYPELQVRAVHRKSLQQDLAKLTEVYNAAWEQNWGFVPITPAEVDFLAERLKPVLREGLVWLAETATEPVAFLLAVPDYNEAFKYLRGRLLTPRLWRALPYFLGWKEPKMARVITLGVKKPYRGHGLESTMLYEGLKVGFRIGFQGAEASWILEDNLKMRRIMELFGGKPYKTYRLYEKAL